MGNRNNNQPAKLNQPLPRPLSLAELRMSALTGSASLHHDNVNDLVRDAKVIMNWLTELFVPPVEPSKG